MRMATPVNALFAATELHPPGEPFSPMMERHIGAKAYANALGSGGQEDFLTYARNGRADRFLAFLEHELHPEIVKRFRVNKSIGLFGHSQGGLFALYALTKRSPLFSVFGASSPAILTARVRSWWTIGSKALTQTSPKGRFACMWLPTNSR